MVMSMLLRRMKLECTVHGFRSCFRDWAAECTGYAHEVCKMVLAHVVGNKSEAAYRRGDLFDRRRRLMADWATYCASGGAAAAKVSPRRGSGMSNCSATVLPFALKDRWIVTVESERHFVMVRHRTRWYAVARRIGHEERRH